MQPARLLRVLLDESDHHSGRPLYEVMVERCRALGMAGATVLRGVEGYGETAALHHTAILHRNRPVELVVVDTAESVATLMRELEPLLHTGLMAVSDVRIRRRTVC
jgi:uncharacterized protein